VDKQLATLLVLISVTLVGAFFLSSDGSGTRRYYRNCSSARAAGVAPLHNGQPGYRSGLDADGDGIACEPYSG
jgi:hypothetical protein